MAIQLWRLTSMMSTAVAMSAAFAHLMEMPAKMRFDKRLYVDLHRTLYPNFGRIAGTPEIVAVLTTGALAVWTRRHRPSAFAATVTAAGCLAAAHGLFWTLVRPANSAMLAWDLDAIPPEWTAWRKQWEYTHAARAVLVTGALAALAWSVIQETPDTDSENR
ncbi:MAG: DUF1772 domain-containing protein [Bryobacterales bacterium]|nr:DUF1772 domain-containing protein [Bryobacterales bacterium]